MEKVVEAEPRAVVFVCDRQGAALGRRERCLKLAGIGPDDTIEARVAARRGAGWRRAPRAES